jgi:hypothetical protein
MSQVVLPENYSDSLIGFLVFNCGPVENPGSSKKNLQILPESEGFSPFILSKLKQQRVYADT